MKKAILALADGAVFEGVSFGYPGETIGEVVFNTGMSGYQEILTDASYREQIVTMTYPLIGNYGINDEDAESATPKAAGFIIRELSPVSSNWRNKLSLDEYLKKHGVVGIQGIDTRALTRHLRDFGAQMGIISCTDLDPRSLVDKARKSPGLGGRDLVSQVTCKQPYIWGEGTWKWYYDSEVGRGVMRQTHVMPKFRVAVYDYGIKTNILRQLVEAGCALHVFPAAYPAEEILKQNFDGVFLSNGPGDPEGVPYAIENIRKLAGKKPIFGICLGHQLIGLALGFKTYKLKFGHHGLNHPVQNLSNGKIEITSQNHNYNVNLDVATLPAPVRATHINLNDRTIEGLEHAELPIFSVQYHPEASPGPHDSHYLFTKFTQLMEKCNASA